MNARQKQSDSFRNFMHAQMRLAYRYGITITIEEYEALSSQVLARKDLRGFRVDELGNLDAWVEFKGKLVCACVKAGARSINTFLPAPPEITQPKKVVEPMSTEVTALQEEILVLRQQVSKRDKRLHALVNSGGAEFLLEVAHYRNHARSLKSDAGQALAHLNNEEWKAARELLHSMQHRATEWKP
jgi:hypothetical protein